jgi:regulatory protein
MPEQRTALVQALHILSRRDHSEAELRRKLTGKGFSDDDQDEALARLHELGYVNDQRFARCFAESAIRNGKGFGFRLRMELVRRGIAESVINETLAALADDYDELTTLRELLARKFRDFDPSRADERRKRRVIGYFQRRGFSLASIVRLFSDEGV